RGDRIHHDVAVFLFWKQRKQHAEAEVETVHHHIDEDRKGDDEGPDDGEVRSDAHGARASARGAAAGVIPAARIGASCRGPCPPGPSPARPGAGAAPDRAYRANASTG